MSETWPVPGEQTRFTYFELPDSARAGLSQAAELVIKSRGLRLSHEGQSGFSGLDQGMTEVLQALRPAECGAYEAGCRAKIEYANAKHRPDSPDVTGAEINISCPSRRFEDPAAAKSHAERTIPSCTGCHHRMSARLIDWLTEVSYTVEPVRELDRLAEAAQELANVQPIKQYQANLKAKLRDQAIDDALKIK
jgi:hypothetical protein